MKNWDPTPALLARESRSPLERAPVAAGIEAGGGTIIPQRNTPSKYRNEKKAGPNGVGGWRVYGSKREARRAEELWRQKCDGQIADFFPQVSLEIGTDEKGRGVRAVLDFLVVEAWLDDGRFVARIEDPKGADTLHSRAKRAALRYRGLEVELL